MLIADIKNKLTLTEHSSEDFLTSAVFSTLSYIEAKWVYEFLNKAVNINKNYLDLKVEKPVFEFWPWFAKISPLKRAVEPDVVIYSGDLAIIIEAKNYSGKSGVGVTTNGSEELGEKNEKDLIDQLGREYFIGRNKLVNSRYHRDGNSHVIKDFVLIFLTRHNLFPENEIGETLESIEQMFPGESEIATEKIYWLNWQKIIPLLWEIEKISEKNTFEVKIAQDLFKFLEKRNLGVFSGFSFLNEFNCQPEIDENLFYRKLFPAYWTFLEQYNANKDENPDTLFYKKRLQPYWHFLGNDFVFKKLLKIYYKGAVT
jgi:hypothetical protein